jgi:CBS domain-containing protein
MTREPFKKIWKKGEALLTGVDGLFHAFDGDSTPQTTRSREVSGPDPGPHMTIREFMTQSPVVTRLETPLHQALELLIKRDLSALPVIDENDIVVGLLNERHLLKALGDLEASTIAAIMDAAPVMVEADEQIIEVVDLLMAINVRQVLVLEASKLVGVVTRADLMPAILQVLRRRARRAHGILLAIH